MTTARELSDVESNLTPARKRNMALTARCSAQPPLDGYSITQDEMMSMVDAGEGLVTKPKPSCERRYSMNAQKPQLGLKKPEYHDAENQSGNVLNQHSLQESPRFAQKQNFGDFEDDEVFETEENFRQPSYAHRQQVKAVLTHIHTNYF